MNILPQELIGLILIGLLAIGLAVYAGKDFGGA